MGEGILDIGNTSLIFWTIVTVGVLLVLLYRFVYPPIRDQIQRRQETIEQAINEAENTRREARQLLEEYRRQIREAREEAREIREEARRQAEARREEIKEEAYEEADKIEKDGREEIQSERESAVRGVRDEVSSMVLQTSEQIVGRSIDEENYESLISEALDELEAEFVGSEGRR